MIPAAFEYRTPGSIDEALELLQKYREDARILAGGHGLIPAMKMRLEAPDVVIDLRRIPGLASIEPPESGGGGVSIGALVTHHEIEVSPLIRERCALLAESASAIGDVQVRNFGTLVGSVCHADPSSDYPAALLALDAEVVIASPRGSRSVPASEFLQGPLETALEPDELVHSVCVPGSHAPTSAYSKMRRSDSGFAIAGVAVQLGMEGGRAREISIGVTGVADRPFRAKALEDALRGSELADAAVEAAAIGIAIGKDLLNDLHASREFRAHLADAHARRAIYCARSRA